MRIRPTRALLACGLMAALCLTLAAAEKKRPERPINVNTATVKELAQLPGVGEVIAARIVRHREVSGPFRSVNELVIVRGISRKMLEKLRPYVTVGTSPVPNRPVQVSGGVR